MVSTDKSWRERPPDLLAQAAASDDEHLAAFFAVMEQIPPGQRFTVNDVRASLDALGIPNTKRGGLFESARHAGLIERAGVSMYGTYVLSTVPSSGRSARHARVASWRRALPMQVGQPSDSPDRPALAETSS